MNVLWDVGEPVKVADVLEQLDTGKPLACTTVMTVLDNPHRKGWTAREQHGRACHHSPAVSGEEASARALRGKQFRRR
ncbi:BlaI/MecI/CopY family transcriptional regulator [Saccharomonospora sp. NPDC006951]